MTVYYDAERAVWRFDFWRNKKRHIGYCIHPDTRAPAANRRDALTIETLFKAAAIRAPADAPASVQAPIVDARYRLAQAAIVYSTAIQSKSSWPSVKRHVEELLRYFGSDRPLDEISTALIGGYVVWAAAQEIEIWNGGPYKRGSNHEHKRAGDKPLWKKTGRTRDARTINRYLDTFRSLLTRAHRTVDPMTRRRLLDAMPEIPYLPIAENTPRPFPLAALKTLIDDAPRHLAETILLCLIFGFRLRQGLYAEASRVDLALGGYWQDARGRGNKGRRGAFIPFGPATRDFVAGLVTRAKAIGIDRLVLYGRRRRNEAGEMETIWRAINSVSTSWTKLLDNHGLKGIHTFHNTKTTLISNIADLASDVVVQDLAQHRDIRTTKKHYIAIGADPKRAALTAFEQRLAGAGIGFAGANITDIVPVQPGNKSRTDSAPSPTRKSHTKRTG